MGKMLIANQAGDDIKVEATDVGFGEGQFGRAIE